MLIKDWEYLEDKLSMGHMALFQFSIYSRNISPINHKKVK